MIRKKMLAIAYSATDQARAYMTVQLAGDVRAAATKNKSRTRMLSNIGSGTTMTINFQQPILATTTEKKSWAHYH
jgi:hypothetical protein